MRTIDADKAIEVANDLYEKYNFAMACADTQREINHIFKRQELFKAVKAVIEHCPTVDPVKHGKWIIFPRYDQLGRRTGYDVVCSNCKHCHVKSFIRDILNYCSACGSKNER